MASPRFMLLLFLFLRGTTSFISPSFSLCYKAPTLRALDDSGDLDDQVVALPAHISAEMERLEYQLSLIEALEERNKAQLESFVDEEDQWESMEEEDRDLLQSKPEIQDQMEALVSELVNNWMGQKSMEG